ncbi:MAG: phosphatase PAP2 family protein [Candidatus Heimdallarchaeota archaeon]|nr:phosphatase PAP2 family protein [Candidatus Heimdallarchaeota archaeon]MDH5647159.1 phosphatase PAP2 family protein [Candidatus Heimdallarchaeota archaeon]
MVHIPFNEDILIWVAEHRFYLLTFIMSFFTHIGSIEGYILLICGIHWLYNKNVGVRAGVALLISAILNHTLKIIIKNPRPFIESGETDKYWAKPFLEADESELGYSTPSGHAMGSSTFFSYIYLKNKSRKSLIISFIFIFMIGISRPYLGVHYLEDVLLGWMIGILVTLLVFKVEPVIPTIWNKQSESVKYIILLVPALLTTIISGVVTNYSEDGTAYVTLSGILSGALFGYVYELKANDFDEDYDEVYIGILRYILGIVLVFSFQIGLDEIFAIISDDYSLLGYILRLIRYFLIGFSITYLAPFLFVKLNLAKTRIEGNKSE